MKRIAKACAVTLLVAFFVVTALVGSCALDAGRSTIALGGWPFEFDAFGSLGGALLAGGSVLAVFAVLALVLPFVLLLPLGIAGLVIGALAFAGIAVGAVLLSPLGLIVGLVWLARRQRKRRVRPVPAAPTMIGGR